MGHGKRNFSLEALFRADHEKRVAKGRPRFICGVPIPPPAAPLPKYEALIRSYEAMLPRLYETADADKVEAVRVEIARLRTLQRITNGCSAEPEYVGQ